MRLILEAFALTSENLMALLSDPQQRSRLQKAMQREQGSFLPVNNRYEIVARTCAATPEQLRAVVKALLPYRRRYERMLEGLVWHPHMSEPTLLLLCEKRHCISALGHRAGPQALLERVAARYCYSEAITTLALSYYSRSEYPTEDFAAFLQEYAGDAMLRYNMARFFDMPADKRAVVQRLFLPPSEQAG